MSEKTITPVQHSAKELFEMLAIVGEVLQISGYQLLNEKLCSVVTKHKKVIEELNHG